MLIVMLLSSTLIAPNELDAPVYTFLLTRVLFVMVNVELLEPAELLAALMFRQAQPLMVLPVMVMFTGLKVVMA